MGSEMCIRDSPSLGQPAKSSSAFSGASGIAGAPGGRTTRRLRPSGVVRTITRPASAAAATGTVDRRRRVDETSGRNVVPAMAPRLKQRRAPGPEEAMELLMEGTGAIIACAREDGAPQSAAGVPFGSTESIFSQVAERVVQSRSPGTYLNK